MKEIVYIRNFIALFYVGKLSRNSSPISKIKSLIMFEIEGNTQKCFGLINYKKLGQKNLYNKVFGKIL